VMELTNTLYKVDDDSEQGRAIMQEALESSVLLLSPIVPHITHQLWAQLQPGAKIIIDMEWPQADQSAMVRDSIELVVQVNGKLRGRIQVPVDADRNEVEDTAMADTNVKRFVDGKAVIKVIVVPGKLVNIVVK